jgi:precorrin-6x reductase
MYNQSDYRLGFGLSNTFLRVYLDDTIIDVSHPFAKQTQWKFVAVSY